MSFLQNPKIIYFYLIFLILTDEFRASILCVCVGVGGGWGGGGGRRVGTWRAQLLQFWVNPESLQCFIYSLRICMCLCVFLLLFFFFFFFFLFLLFFFFFFTESGKSGNYFFYFFSYLT